MQIKCTHTHTHTFTTQNLPSISSNPSSPFEPMHELGPFHHEHEHIANRQLQVRGILTLLNAPLARQGTLSWGQQETEEKKKRFDYLLILFSIFIENKFQMNWDLSINFCTSFRSIVQLPWLQNKEGSFSLPGVTWKYNRKIILIIYLSSSFLSCIECYKILLVLKCSFFERTTVSTCLRLFLFKSSHIEIKVIALGNSIKEFYSWEKILLEKNLHRCPFGYLHWKKKIREKNIKDSYGIGMCAFACLHVKSWLIS